MRLITPSILLGLLLPLAAGAQDGRQTYKWVDDEGQTHYGDSVPPEYADKRKAVLNEQGVAVGQVEGKKTEEQLAEEEKQKELEVQRELQLRADKALLATYLTQEEIEMHRDRRVELFRAQARVTELYLRNLARRLDQLKGEAGRYKPYSSDPDAEMIDPSLVSEIDDTEDAIKRHEQNLQKFRQEERDIIDRFDGDIRRFRILKGLDEPQSRTASSNDGVPQIVPE